MDAANRFAAPLMAATLLLLCGLFWLPPARAQPGPCPERPRCSGCGCAGGPGYRGPDGRCVGFRRLAAVCGDPPTTRCSFENAPNTGLNHDCALRPRDRTKPSFPDTPALPRPQLPFAATDGS
jgi:hypothetical protein